MKHSKRIHSLVLSALFLALGLVLPFFTGQIPQIGSMLLPMHIPALLCGLICGWQYGAVVGFIMPLMRSLLFTMPPLLTAVAMAFELAAYGLDHRLGIAGVPVVDDPAVLKPHDALGLDGNGVVVGDEDHGVPLLV